MAAYQRGKLVEFTDRPQFDIPLGDTTKARYGVVLADSDGPTVQVQTPDPGFGPLGLAVTVPVNCIHAYAWAGWYPEELDAIVDAVCGRDDSDYYGDDY